MRAATKRLVSVLVSIGLLVTAVILFSSLVVPAYQEVQQLRGEKESLDAVIEEEEQLVATASRLLSEYQNAADLRNNLSLVLPRDEALPGAINQVQGIAQATDVGVDGINVENLPLTHSKTSSIVSPASGFRITVRLKGSYEGLKSYIQSLETNVRIIDIESVVISGGGKSEPLTTNLVLKTYYQK